MAAPARQMPRPKVRRETVSPLNLGMYLDRPPHLIPKGGLVECLNIRIKYGEVVAGQIGYEDFLLSPPNLDPPLNGVVLLIDEFFLRDGTNYLIFGTKLDMYYYDTVTGQVFFITPTYTTGTITAAVEAGGETTLTGGGGTQWDTAPTVKRGGSDNKNVRAGDYIYIGSAAQNDPTASSWYEVKQVDSDTQMVVYGDADGLTGSYTLRQLFSGDDEDIWSSEIFPSALPADEDTWYAVQGFEWVKWGAAAAAAASPLSRVDPGFTARQLIYYRNMLLAGDIQVGADYLPGHFRNSKIAQPEEFSGDEAHQLASTTGIDQLLTFAALGDVLVAYHDSSINILQFVDLPVVWAVRGAIPGIGPRSSRATMDFGDYHELIAADAQYRFDGITIQDTNNHVFREVLRRVDPNRLVWMQAHIDEENGDLLWIVPLTTDENTGPEQAYQAHYLEEVGKKPTPITRRRLPATATGFYEQISAIKWSDLVQTWASVNFRWNDRYFAAAFPLNLFGDENGNVFKMNTCENFDGANIYAYAKVARFAAADGRNKGMLRRIEPFVEKRPAAGYGLFITAMPVNGTRVTSPNVYAPSVVHRGFWLDHRDRRRWKSFRLPCLYFDVQFWTVLQNQPWELSGFAYESQEIGI